jgi:hypothetical protein
LRQARLGSHDRLFASHGRECRIHAAIQRHVTFGTTKFLSGGAIDAYAQRKRQQSGTKENIDDLFQNATVPPSAIIQPV